MTQIHFISLGCPKNLVDSEVMLGKLTAEGYALTDDPTKAQVIVVNTCAFVADAKKEAVDTILEMAEFKKSGSCRLLVVTGCLPQRYHDELADLMPEVDLFIGAGEFHRIVELIEASDSGMRTHVSRPEYLYDHETPRVHTTPQHVGYLKVAEGCFHPCSFCIIPQLRGPFRSRPLDSVVAEASAMAGRGVKEINLIAQDLTAYGRDIGVDLATLLDRLAAIEGRRWIRLLYAYPHAFPDGVIRAMKEHSDICNYIDIPIQHISDRVLSSMRRGGNGYEIRKLIERFRRYVPGVSIRTSLIVGYPGETDAEFDELLDFVCEMRFEHLGAFVFSPEEGTRAAKLEGRVPLEVAEARRRELMGVQREISLGNNDKYVGKIHEVLVEGVSEESEHLLQARHEGQAPDIDGVIYINDGLANAGEFAMVEVTEAHEYDLIGRII